MQRLRTILPVNTERLSRYFSQYISQKPDPTQPEGGDGAAVAAPQYMTKQLPITEVRIDWGKMPVDVRFSYGAPETFPFAVVQLFSDEIRGIGENHLPVSDELQQAVSSLLGADARRLDGLLTGIWQQIPQAQREAFSMALYDLVGRASGLPVYTLLGGAQRTVVPLEPCIFPQSPEHAGQCAAKFVAEGFRALKVKIFGELEGDLAIIRAVREALGDEGYLQADANEGYPAAEVSTETMKALEHAGLDAAEDLIDGDLDDLRALRGCSSVQIMPDAPARSLEGVGQILRADAADRIQLHAGQNGTFTQAQAKYWAAASFGVPAFVGGTGYCGIGTAAYHHLATVIGLEGPCGELGGAFDHGMPEDLVQEPLPIEDGHVIVPQTPGLGVELDEQALERHATDHWGTA